MFSKTFGVYKAATYYINKKAMMQQMAATGNSPRRNHAATIPANSAMIPGHGVGVARIISGKVMTASVT